MPYSITTRDGITVQNIPDDVPQDSLELKQRVAKIRAQGTGSATSVDAATGVQRSGAALVPAAEEVATGVYAPPVVPNTPAPTLVDRAVGTGEAALTTVTGATGGALGMALGGGNEIVKQILSGQLGTPEAARAAEAAAAQGAQALTYAPRTEQGQEQAAAVGGALQQLLPIAGVVPALVPPGVLPRGTPAGVVARAGAEGVVRDIAGDGAATAAARVADLAGKNISTLPRRALEALRKPAEDAAPTPGTMGSVGSAGADLATQRRATAGALPAPVELTKGQASRDFAQLRFEQETSKDPGVGARLRERYAAQNQAILDNFDAWVDQTGAEAPSLRATGAAVDKVLAQQVARDKAEIRAGYKMAEKAGELEQPVELGGLVQHLNESAPDAATAPLLDVARRRALQLGIATEGEGGALVPQPVPLKKAETYRQAIGRATDYEATNVRQSTIIKGLVDEGTEGVGGELYRQARALRARYAQNYENRATVNKLLDTKRGSADRMVAFEDVFDHGILKGSLDDVRNLRRVLHRAGGDGEQAWRELQGSTVSWIRNEATKGVATDQRGNPIISPAGLNKAIRTLDADGRLDFVFGKKGAQQLRDINDISRVVFTAPPGAVNTSNTASVLLAALGEAAAWGGATGGLLPVPVLTGLRQLSVVVKDRRIQQRVDAALNEATAQARRKKAIRAAAPAKNTFH